MANKGGGLKVLYVLGDTHDSNLLNVDKGID